ncbi:hypothetical protein [Brachybacterium sp. GPGPB12]|uniref:hypothetical protein n=1 Tax=Brachybacterium sp. GPGPB12 TaxID=3023517 RepID=UPI0031342556
MGDQPEAALMTIVLTTLVVAASTSIGLYTAVRRARRWRSRGSGPSRRSPDGPWPRSRPDVPSAPASPARCTTSSRTRSRWSPCRPGRSR